MAILSEPKKPLKEKFLNQHRDLLFADIPAFAKELMNCLVWYNTKRAHKALGNLSCRLFIKHCWSLRCMRPIQNLDKLTKKVYHNCWQNRKGKIAERQSRKTIGPKSKKDMAASCRSQDL